jgi:hypothetical protein
MLDQEVPMKWVAVIFSALAALMIFCWWYINKQSVVAQNPRTLSIREQIIAAILKPKGDGFDSVVLDPKKFPALVRNACFAAKMGYDKWRWKEAGKDGYDYGGLMTDTCTNLVLTASREDKVHGVYVSIDFDAWRGVYKWRVEWDLRSNDGINFDPQLSYGMEVNMHVVTGR